MREDLSLSCHSLSASCILSFSPHLPYSIMDFSHFHTTLSLSFVFLIVFFFKSCFSLPSFHLTPSHLLPRSVLCKLIFSFAYCKCLAWSVLHSRMESILHSIRQIAMVCLHGLWFSDYETLQWGAVSPK